MIFSLFILRKTLTRKHLFKELPEVCHIKININKHARIRSIQKLMLDVNKLTVNIPEGLSNKALEFAKEMWLGMPKWLRYLLIITVVGGALYFLYNRLSLSYDVTNLEEELANLNSHYQESVLYDRYQYDIQNVVTTVKTLQIQFTTLCEFQTELIDILDASHNEPTLHNQIEKLRQRYKLSLDSYDKIIKYQIEMYEDWLKQQHNNVYRVPEKKTELIENLKSKKDAD